MQSSTRKNNVTRLRLVLFSLLIVANGLVSCTREAEITPSSVIDAQNTRNQQTLDLSLSPRNAIESEEWEDQASNANRINGEKGGANNMPDFFEQENNKDQQDKAVSVSAKPYLKSGASITDVPSVDGASVSLEVKTKWSLAQTFR